MKLGFHVSIGGNIANAVDRAQELNCGTMQIFSRNPRAWRRSGISDGDAALFRKKRLEADIRPLLVHIPYLVNLSSPDGIVRKRSIGAFSEDLRRSDVLGAEFFVTHLGSHRGSGESGAIKRVAHGLNGIIGETDPQVKILLETTAGSGSSIGYRFEQIAAIIGSVSRKEAVGVCVDTQHLYAAGYDIVNDLDGVLDRFDKLIGKDMLSAVHLNDSKTPFGSRVDRHEHLGNGTIGLTALKSILNHPALKRLPFIMETPKKSIEDDIRNMEVARSLLNT